MGEHLHNPYEYDPDEDPRTDFDPKFMMAHQAEGANIHELKASRFAIPVSFTLAENGRFVLTGETRKEESVIVSGLNFANLAKINHIELTEGLKGSGMGRALLSDLENQLKQHGVSTVYSTFFSPGTIEFFLRNGYQIIPISSLNKELKIQLAIDASDFEQGVANEEDYRLLKEMPRKILMKKNL